MAHFAKIEDGVVVSVVVVPDENENNGQQFLNSLGLHGKWVQTSYNTYGGQHLAGGTPLRKNFAGVGYTYDEELDAFIEPQPFPSWVLNPETGLYDPPTPRPDGPYFWDEETTSWVLAIPTNEA